MALTFVHGDESLGPGWFMLIPKHILRVTGGRKPYEPSERDRRLEEDDVAIMLTLMAEVL